MSRSTSAVTRAHLRRTILPLLLLTLLAFFLRVWRLDKAPPGWRDDELINSLVISQKVLDGQWAVYYADASGHEALYHILNAAMLALFGPGVAGIRLLSAFLGALTVPLTFLVARRLFGRPVGFLAAALLAVSFWSLMYSRAGIRHISLPVFMLPTFYFFLRGLGIGRDRPGDEGFGQRRSGVINGDFLLAGLFMGLGFYTYFASRGIPLILLVFCVYLLLFQRNRLRGKWRGLALSVVLAVVLASPLLVTLARQPESEARVEELAVPLVAAREGDFSPLLDQVKQTLSMFHSYGDEEWLYNIPLRPVFGPAAAAFFWSGVAIAAWYAFRPLGRLLSRSRAQRPQTGASLNLEAAGAFTLIWWLGGISPAFVSVPAASLGHTIIAQSVTYILAALPLLVIGRFVRRRLAGRRNHMALRLAMFAVALLLLAIVAWRDLPDYFVNWPERGMTRFLYRADIRDLAGYLNENKAMSDFGVGGFLAGPWDRLALNIDLQDPAAARARWFNPERATLLATAGKAALVFRSDVPGPALDEPAYTPVDDVTVAGYSLYEVDEARLSGASGNSLVEPVCFQNGLCAQEALFDGSSHRLSITWQVEHSLDLPEQPLTSNPPPPNVYAGPRLLVFAQLLDQQGQFLVGDDGLWVDASTLWPGDRFRQSHYLAPPAEGAGYHVAFGLYDPLTGQRIATEDGRDHIELQVGP
jgi:4-amino-4-deoxy-L-arabinose transferase-like glycosyltransferase